MTPADPSPSPPQPPAETTAPSPEALTAWLRGRRWFHHDEPRTSGGTESTAPATMRIIALPTSMPLGIGLLHHADATYQVIAPTGADRSEPDLGSDPAAAAALVDWVATDPPPVTAEPGTIRGRWLEDATAVGAAPSRALGGEQSNTSVAIGGTHVLKLFRRLQRGVHPEIEIGRHLALTAPDAPVATLSGWYELHGAGASGADDPTALGVIQEFVPGALDAWGLVLSALAGSRDSVLAGLHELGGAVARLHVALARPGVGTANATDPERPEAFGATPFGADRLQTLVQAIGLAGDRILATGLDRAPELAALAGRGDEVHARAEQLAAGLGPDLGAAIRHHGDLHLGQVVLGDHGWVILDFEGEPSRPLQQRRLRHAPLRDVAGMLRSFAYAAATHQRADPGALGPGWEPAARAAFLDGYLATIDPVLLPSSAATTASLLALFELEKVLYEVDYELAHRPDWVHLPVAGLRRFIEDGTP